MMWINTRLRSGHGIFFYHVIEGLKGGPKDEPIARAGQVTVPLLEDYLSRAVPVAVKKDRDDRSLKQTPERKGSLRGEGVLALVARAPVPKDRPKEPVEAKAEPKTGEQREIAKGVKIKFCWIPKGNATLGSPKEEKGRQDNENEHEYKTDGFWMGKYEVSNENG